VDWAATPPPSRRKKKEPLHNRMAGKERALHVTRIKPNQPKDVNMSF
jgi:hypothetical protein